MNVEWGVRTHREWAVLCAVGSALWFVAGIVVSIADGQTLAGYLVAVLLPSMPLLMDCWDSVFDHVHLADSRAQVDLSADHVWQRFVSTSTRDIGECRKIQDRIWHLRRDRALIPDWFYRLRRNAHETDMQGAASRLVTEARAASGTAP